MLEAPTVLKKPSVIDFTGNTLEFKFQVEDSYINYSSYKVHLMLRIEELDFNLYHTVTDGFAYFDITKLLKSSFQELEYSNFHVKKAEKLIYEVSYKSLALIEEEESVLVDLYGFECVNLQFSSVLLNYLNDNNLFVSDYFKTLMLSPVLFEHTILKTSYSKKEFISVILFENINFYTLKYTLNDNTKLEEQISFSFEKNTVYTIDISLQKENVKAFRVEIGSVYQDYVIDYSQKKQSYNLIYLNSYNLFESIELTGQKSTKAILSKTSFYRNGVRKSFDNKFRFEFIFDTQLLFEEQNYNLIEFANSNLLYVKLNDWEEIDLAITDFEINNDGAKFYSNEIKALSSKEYSSLPPFRELPPFTVELSSLAVDEAFVFQNYASDEYSMFVRTVVNPIDRTIIQTWKTAYSHTYATPFLYFRKSTDAAASFTTPAIISLSEYVMNPTPVFTKKGRLIIFIQKCPDATTYRDAAGWIYSDNNGDSFSDINYFIEPTAVTPLVPSYFYANQILYNETGEALIPFCTRVTEKGRNSVRLAKSTDNGETWIDSEIEIFNNVTGTLMEFTEMEWVDAGNGIFIIIARAIFNTNPDGHNTPAMFVSFDYGQTWKDDGTHLVYEDLALKNNLSGWLNLEGPSINIGEIGPTYNDVLPGINLIEIRSEKWLVIFYWIRRSEAGTQEEQVTVQKWTIIKLSDFLTNGVDAIKDVRRTLFNEVDHGGANKNGGNGCAANYGNDLIFSTYAQLSVTSSNGRTNIHSHIIKEADILALIEEYNNINY